ncbi:hypothetical protein FYJ39_20075 [Clostridium sp. WCA-389-WT-23D1]|uniref:Uncharacterized protein n=1 Tax=Clostridium porci TaxID=2605778 RepID=A0A7X2NPQ9_9CLOT|nr:hypothetical protein [Clostridium porci]
MLKVKNAIKKYRCVPVATGVASVAMAFSAFAEEGTPATGLNGLLATFSVVTAWLWKECGLLLTWILSQPILLAAMCLFFAGAVVAFFMRIYHQV